MHSGPDMENLFIKMLTSGQKMVYAVSEKVRYTFLARAQRRELTIGSATGQDIRPHEHGRWNH